MQRKLLVFWRVLVVTELYNIAVNDFDAKESARCRRVLIVIEIAVNVAQCTLEDMLQTFLAMKGEWPANAGTVSRVSTA